MRATFKGLLLRWLVNGTSGAYLAWWLVDWLLLYCQVKLEHVLNRLADVRLGLDQVRLLLFLIPYDLVALKEPLFGVFFFFWWDKVLVWMECGDWTSPEMHDFFYFGVWIVKYSHLIWKLLLLGGIRNWSSRLLVLWWGLSYHGSLFFILRWLWEDFSRHFILMCFFNQEFIRDQLFFCGSAVESISSESWGLIL